MELFFAAAALALIALALPARPGLALAERYRRLESASALPPVRRRLLAGLPAHRLLPLLPRRYVASMQSQLRIAQLSEAWPLPDFVALKLMASVLMVGLMGLYWWQTKHNFFLFAMLLQSAAGWSLPDFYVKRRAAGRLAAAERELPAFLSNLSICLQTGLSLRSSLLQLAALGPGGTLGKELQTVSAHLAAGATPTEALAAMIERCRTPELSQALRTVAHHAERSPSAAAAAAAAEAKAAWQRKRRRAERIAQTASLKLFFPQLLLGLPSLFLVLLGPAALKLWDMIHSF